MLPCRRPAVGYHSVELGGLTDVLAESEATARPKTDRPTEDRPPDRPSTTDDRRTTTRCQAD